MPSPHEQLQGRVSDTLNTAFKRALEGLDSPTLSFELAEMRKELAEIRSAVCPSPSPILTGAAVREEYFKLVKQYVY